MLFFYIIIPAILVALGNYLFFNKKVVWQEVALQIGGIVLLMAAIVFGCSAGKKWDTEILNGHVVSKARHEVSCRHSYPCHCYTYECGDSKNPSTCTHCDTCYEHDFDVDWDVEATTGMTQEEFSVNTIDSQGLQEPPRWTQFKAGDPFMDTKSYQNYVKANADTIYKTHGYQDRFAKAIPGYPISIGDYHTKLDRFLQVGVNMPDATSWSRDLTDLNCELGPKKQTNIIMLVTSGQPEEYYYGVKEAWIGGKKNDVIVMIDVATDGHINWTNTLSWAKNDIVRVKLRDDILAIGKMDRVLILRFMHDDIEQLFVRKRMREFEYLNSAIILSDAEFWWMLIGAFLLSIGISVFVDMNDFDRGGGYRSDY